MVLKQLYGSRRAKGVLLETEVIREPIGYSFSTAVNSGSWYEIYAKNFTPSDLDAGGKAQYYKVSLNASAGNAGEGWKIGFFINDVLISPEIPVDDSSRAFSSFLKRTNFSGNQEIEVKVKAGVTNTRSYGCNTIVIEVAKTEVEL